MHVATLADSWAGIIYTGTWYITYCGMLWSSSGEHCGSARGHQQHKIWISRGGTLSPPLRRTFVFLSRVHCGGLEVGGGGSHWLMGGQSAHRQLLPYSPPNPLIHPTLLSFSDSIAALNIHYPDLRGQSWPIIRQYSPHHHHHHHHQHLNNLDATGQLYCLGALLTLLSYSCTFLMDHWLRRASPVFPDL